MRTGFYFSCFEVTSVRQERLSPPGIGFTTSINGDDGPGIIVVRIVIASFWYSNKTKDDDDNDDQDDGNY